MEIKEEESPNSLKAKKKSFKIRGTQDRGCLRKKQKETERSGRNECKNRRVIIIARHMTATKP